MNRTISSSSTHRVLTISLGIILPLHTYLQILKHVEIIDQKIKVIKSPKINYSLSRIDNNEIIPSSFDAELNILPSFNEIYKTALFMINND